MSKKKIFYALSVFLILGMTMSVLNARAHPPINVHINYTVNKLNTNQVDRGQVDVIYTHGVSDPKVHFISSIEVWVNVTQRWVEHASEGKYDLHGIYYWDLDNYGVAIPPPLDTADIDHYEDDYYPTVAPNYTFFFDEQETQITEITTSHTLVRYYLDVPGLKITGKEEWVKDPISGEDYLFRGEGRTNITLRANCTFEDWEGNPSSLTEHYYVGLPYYNPHLTFAEAAAPATVSTIIVFALLFILPKAGQKSAPKLKEGKIKH